MLWHFLDGRGHFFPHTVFIQWLFSVFLGPICHDAGNTVHVDGDFRSTRVSWIFLRFPQGGDNCAFLLFSCYRHHLQCPGLVHPETIVFGADLSFTADVFFISSRYLQAASTDCD